MRKFSFLEKIIINFFTPIVAIKVLFKDMVCARQEKNGIRQGKPLTGLKKGKISKDYSVEELKVVGRRYGVTINDIIMAVTSQSIKQYLTKKGDTETELFKLSMQFSLREAPESIKEFELKNNFAMMTIPLQLHSDFETGLTKIKKQMDLIKRSFDPFGVYFLVKITTLLPTVLAKLVSLDMTRKISLVFSNVPGPKKPLIISGKTVHSIVFFAPGMGNLNASLNIVSHADVLKVACVSDNSLIQDPALMIDLFEKNFEVIMEDTKKSK